MVERSQSLRRRPVSATANPIEQSDLESLKVWSREDPPPYRRLGVEDLPERFGFDKFRLMVRKEFATVLPNADDTGSKELSELPEADDNTAGPSRPNGTVVAEPQGPTTLGEPGRDSDGDVVEEVVNAFLAEFAGSATHTGREHPSADSAPDTTSTPMRLLVPHTPDNVDGSTGRTLRKRPQQSYREPSGGGGAKPKQSRSTLVKTLEIPRRYCPSEVPLTLLSALNIPCLFHLEVAEQLSPLLSVLCRLHL